jgi:nucleoside-diphosphate-sugar epimerase
MKVFVTGASGFIGSAIVQELLHAGHTVTGLARSAASAEAIRQQGAAAVMGDLENPDILKQAAASADGVIHTAFIHDFNEYAKANDTDKAAIMAIGEALEETSKPFIITAGILGLPNTTGMITEKDAAKNSPRSSEATGLALTQKGIHTSVVRLPPSVHDKGDKGFVPFIIQQARKHGVSAYPGVGDNRWPAVHRLDAARVFRLALEKGAKGALYNAVGETGVTTQSIAGIIGKQLNLPVTSLTGESLAKHFEWMNFFIGFDSPASSFITQEELNWKPVHITLQEDMERHYF